VFTCYRAFLLSQYHRNYLYIIYIIYTISYSQSRIHGCLGVQHPPPPPPQTQHGYKNRTTERPPPTRGTTSATYLPPRRTLCIGMQSLLAAVTGCSRPVRGVSRRPGNGIQKNRRMADDRVHEYIILFNLKGSSHALSAAFSQRRVYYIYSCYNDNIIRTCCATLFVIYYYYVSISIYNK